MGLTLALLADLEVINCVRCWNSVQFFSVTFGLTVITIELLDSAMWNLVQVNISKYEVWNNAIRYAIGKQTSWIVVGVSCFLFLWWWKLQYGVCSKRAVMFVSVTCLLLVCGFWFQTPYCHQFNLKCTEHWKSKSRHVDGAVYLKHTWCGKWMKTYPYAVAYGGGGGLGCSNPPPRNSEGPPKPCQTQPDLWKLLKIAEFRMPTPRDVQKKGTKILKLPRFAIVFH